MAQPRYSDAALISSLSSSSSSLQSDLHKSQKNIAPQEKSLEAEMETVYFDELYLKEVEKIEANHRCDVLEKEVQDLKHRCTDFDDKIARGVEFGRNLEAMMKRCDRLECRMDVLQNEVLEWRKRHGEVVVVVSELMEENSRLRSLWECNQSRNGRMDGVCTSTPKRKSGLATIAIDSDDDDRLVRVPTGILDESRKKLKKNVWENEGSDELGTPNSSFYQGDGDRVKRLLFPSPECLTETEINAHCVAESLSGDESRAKIIKRTSSTPEAVKRRFFVSDTDDNDEDYGSESEGDSLGGFIVNESDCSGRNLTCSGATDENSACNEDDSTTVEDLDVLLTKISGKRGDKDNWEYEADMLASFAKNPELCMEAVCALYRMQTEEEKSVKGTLLLNNRGFNFCDAHRGSMIAEFLMDGDPQCRLRKSVNELEMYDPSGPEYCHMLANRYSKQLFNIYKNNEDPFFPPFKQSSSI